MRRDLESSSRLPFGRTVSVSPRAETRLRDCVVGPSLSLRVRALSKEGDTSSASGEAWPGPPSGVRLSRAALWPWPRSRSGRAEARGIHLERRAPILVKARSCPPNRPRRRNRQLVRPRDGTPEPSRSRQVPAAIWDQTLERAWHRCEYREPDGRCCIARTALEIDVRTVGP